MHITIIGTGYVGLVSGVCFAEFGWNVTCVDNNAEKVKNLRSGSIPIYEPGLDQMVMNNVEAGRLKFTTDLSSSVPNADIVFIAVGTPTRRGGGHADLTYVYEATKEIAKHLKDFTVVVTKSTVPVGTGRKVDQILKEENPTADFEVASNPEFLREGAAIDDFMRPDRVIIGTTGERGKKYLEELYRPLNRIDVPIINVSLETAELTKYSANAFLAMKISFINEVADLCEKVGANVQDIAKGIGLDKRIGEQFLRAGPGYGGSCFPKDTLALVKTANDFNSPISLVEATVKVNAQRPIKMAQKIDDFLGGVKGKKIAVLGLTFKPDTDDMRDSPALFIIPELLSKGAMIAAYDPKGEEQARKYFSKDKIAYYANSYDTLQDADALVLMTEWNEFRALDFDRVKKLMRTPNFVDLRNIYKSDDMRKNGFSYMSLGREAYADHTNSNIKIDNMQDILADA